ncbi:MAG: 50S ribosomal protein L5 [Fimbriimonadaceae bacterium]
MAKKDQGTPTKDKQSGKSQGKGKGQESNSGKQLPLPAPRLKKIYQDTVVGKMMDEFKYTSVMQVPRLTKVVVNMGVSDGDEKEIDNCVRDMQVITGQKPVVTTARKSVSNFKIREGMKIGCKVTLRGDQMYHFLDKLITVALPRIRDFQGLPANSFDGRGNYTLGLKEQLVFLEIDYDSFDKVRGMDITLTTTAPTDQEGRALLKALGMPIRES